MYTAFSPYKSRYRHVPCIRYNSHSLYICIRFVTLSITNSCEAKMETDKNTQLAIADPAFLARLDSRLERIESNLKNLRVIPEDEFLSPDEFMEKVKIRKTKFFLLISSGLLEHKKVGRKIYIPTTQVRKYFAGEMNLAATK